MQGSGILVLLLVGLVAGWLAGQIVRGRGFGLVGDLVVGVVGAFIGRWIFGALGIFVGMGLIGAVISATIGAVILVAIIRLVRRA
ncbi:MAG: GlsB/YeaQ/YmgE family stress response membrane protein [Alphaproteobacteria bacterium]|nr:GlsB/YeaQ/YmgE family stress response membrane protein [Alphaproteobacteria bacterium]MDE1931175.1 GlsB/YeaQ/YmgE family stress response membrane protein [Alphaproteobacteria bacterium]MDE1968496.1 GlsB/YeaQ/YmgE family stress response membrane protein [Alphaproteobacteria bacterium]